MKLLIKNGRVIDPVSGLDEGCDVAISAGRILAIKNIAAGFSANRVIDASGCIVAPGLVDLAARLREALASNTIGGSAGAESKWRGMADEVREAQSSFSRLVPVPGETGKDLFERFHKAVNRFYDQYPRKVPQQAAPPPRRRPEPEAATGRRSGPGPRPVPGARAGFLASIVKSGENLVLPRAGRHPRQDGLVALRVGVRRRAARPAGSGPALASPHGAPLVRLSPAAGHLLALLAASCAFCSPVATGRRAAKISLKIGLYALLASRNFAPKGASMVSVPVDSANGEVETLLCVTES